jgi:uncharacterized protein
MRTIALEEHFVTPEFLELTKAFLPDSPYLREIHSKLADLGAGRIAAMDEAGIDLQVLSLAAIGFDKLDAKTATSPAHDINNRLASAVKAYPQRFARFASLGLRDPESACPAICSRAQDGVGMSKQGYIACG